MSTKRESLARRALGALRAWWQRYCMADLTAYLSQAESHTELEYRIRSWNQRAQPDRMPFL